MNRPRHREAMPFPNNQLSQEQAPRIALSVPGDQPSWPAWAPALASEIPVRQISPFGGVVASESRSRSRSLSGQLGSWAHLR